MTIGATTGKEPDHVEDGDLKSIDELRGAMRDIGAAKKSMGELATVQGIRTEITVLKQQLEMTHEQMRRLIGMYQTLTAEFEQFKQARIRELNVMVNCGSTTPEDREDGADARSGN